MVINVADILYIKASVNDCYIHVTSGSVYKTRSTLEAMEAQVGEYFLKVHRTYLVCIMAIHTLEDTLTLINGEELNYATRRRKEILAQLQEKQRKLIATFAFTDIEMIFNEDRHAVDWIFRYGNEKLAEVERVPLSGLIGNSFGNIFSNMDDKWLCTYERATLYGERLEIMAYSPEIDTELKIICFPTFSGHCGCMLFPLDEIHCAQKQDELSQIWKNYLLKQE